MSVCVGAYDKSLAVSQQTQHHHIIMRIRFNELALDTLSYLFMVHLIYWVNGSEFPERECCDKIFSSPPNPEPVQPTRSSITPTQFIASTDLNSTTGWLIPYRRIYTVHSFIHSHKYARIDCLHLDLHCG